MKKLSRLKLTTLHNEELNKKEQNTLKGGGCFWCSCGCSYAGDKESPSDSQHGGSSTADNDSANDGGWFW